MPGSNENTRLLASLCFQRFQGDPALVVEILDDDPGLSPDEIEKKRLDICMAGGDPAEIMVINHEYEYDLRLCPDLNKIDIS